LLDPGATPAQAFLSKLVAGSREPLGLRMNLSPLALKRIAVPAPRFDRM
jgi:hypothetical protein